MKINKKPMIYALKNIDVINNPKAQNHLSVFDKYA